MYTSLVDEENFFPPQKDPTTDRYCFRGAAMVLHKLLSSPQITDRSPHSVQVVVLRCSARPELMCIVTVAGVLLYIHLRSCRGFKRLSLRIAAIPPYCDDARCAQESAVLNRNVTHCCSARHAVPSYFDSTHVVFQQRYVLLPPPFLPSFLPS